MKGIVFTEFIEFVEDEFGYAVAQHMIEQAQTSTEGVYTAVGTYDASELLHMVDVLAVHSKSTVEDLLQSFGTHLFSRFAVLYPHFFKGGIHLMDFISNIDQYIHFEVQKLYTDAELPSIETIDKSDDSIHLIYNSKRKLSDFALGLLKGASIHFNEKVSIKKELIHQDGSKVRFLIKKI